MTAIDIFRHWQDLVGDPFRTPWGRDDVYGFFQRFRPNGDGLGKALFPLPKGGAILDRMRLIFLATIDGSQDAAACDAYFIVRNPPSISAVAAESLLRSHLQNVAAIAASVGAVELVECLREPVVTSSLGSPPRGQGRHDTDVFINDTLCDWVGSLSPEPPEITELRDAFYSIACDYCLAWHLMWPWFGDSTDVKEPFAPYFNLWQHGVEYRFGGPSMATLFIPNRD